MMMGEILRPLGPLVCVVGARPNYMKIAPLVRAFGAKRSLPGVVLVHTGQHYDTNMSDVFFQQLEIPAPDVNLGVGSGSHARQTAEIMSRFEPVVLERRPDLVLVYGDVNSTMAAALVAAKLGIRVGHVEAGLRSRDWSMPEEINRVVTDRVSDLLFAPSVDAVSEDVCVMPRVCAGACARQTRLASINAGSSNWKCLFIMFSWDRDING